MREPCPGRDEVWSLFSCAETWRCGALEWLLDRIEQRRRDRDGR